MKPKFYVYAGYYENYISTKPLSKPRILRRYFKRNIRAAIRYAESFEDCVIFCTNTRKYLRDRNLIEWLDEHHEWYDPKTDQLC